MGTQVNFRSTGGDLGDLDREIRRLGLVVVRDRLREPPDPTGIVVESLWEAFDASVSVVLARPDDLTRISWRFVEQQDLWVLLSLEQPVVDYMPGHLPDGAPKARSGAAHGRFWIDTAWWDADGKKVEQSPELLSSGQKLMSWVRRTWVRVDGMYESPAAKEALDAIVNGTE